jgi:hypothetical protein
MAAMLLILTGCETTNHKDERSAGRVLDDKNITADVQKSLQTEPTFKFPEVSVTTFAGIVQLSGFVNSDAQRQRAQEIAQNSEGVKEVVNGIALKPMLPATSRPASVQKIYSGESGETTTTTTTTTTGSDQVVTPPKQKD